MLSVVLLYIAHGIIPETVKKQVRDVLEISTKASDSDKNFKRLSRIDREKVIRQLTIEMRDAAKILEFEHAAYLRDKIKLLKGEK